MAKTLQTCRGEACGVKELKDTLVLVVLMILELFVIIGAVQMWGSCV